MSGFTTDIPAYEKSATPTMQNAMIGEDLMKMLDEDDTTASSSIYNSSCCHGDSCGPSAFTPNTHYNGNYGNMNLNNESAGNAPIYSNHYQQPTVNNIVINNFGNQ